MPSSGVGSDVNIEFTIIGDANPNEPRSCHEKIRIFDCLKHTGL